jgi:uncharacterized caspase-like protein
MGKARSAVPILLLCAALALPGHGQDRRFTPTGGGRRVALVIGNSNYSWKPLVNPVNDARAVAQTLRDIGFPSANVHLVIDARQTELRRSVREFVEGVRAGDVALVYYAGHGVEVKGGNYMLPVDLPADASENYVEDEAVSAQRLLRDLDDQGARVRILILDACRDNPLRASRSAGGGLAPMEGKGSLVVFSTEAGRTAADTPGQSNSVFTQFLLQGLRQPGVSIDDAMKRVSRNVARATDERQVPAIYGLLLDDVILVSGSGSAPAPAPAPTPVTSAAPVSRPANSPSTVSTPAPTSGTTSRFAKDQAEADLINSVSKTTDPAQKIRILDEWTAKYPQTAFETERLAEYMNDYVALKDCRNESRIGTKMLSSDANSEPALRAIIGCIYQIKDPDASEMQTAERAANYLVDHASEVYSAARMPAGVAAAQWEAVKNAMVLAARNVTPQIDILKNDNPKAEADLTKVLQADPSDLQASILYANVLFNQRQADPNKQPPAIFEFARAGVYDGPNSLPADQRPAYVNAATRYYTIYHGSNEGLDKMLALAKSNALPPAGWTIESTTDVAIRQAKDQEERDKADPAGAVWRAVKQALTSDGDVTFFDSNVKDSGLPSPDGTTKFKGKIVSMTPAVRPKILVIAYENPAGDITLQLKNPLPGRMEPGAEIEFNGVAAGYTKSPFMLTLRIDDNRDITGWKPIPAAVK